MDFVTAKTVDLVSPISFCERFGETYVYAHDDGTIILRDEGNNPKRLWLNPGQRVHALTIFDDLLLVAYHDCLVRVFSVNSGLLVRSFKLPFICRKFAVFEFFVVCIPFNRPEYCVLDRQSLELLENLDVASFAIDAFNVHNKVVIVCTEHLYFLVQNIPTSYNLSHRLLCVLKSPIFSATQATNGKILFVGSDNWRLVGLLRDTLEVREELSAHTPELLLDSKTIGMGLLIKCSNKRYIFLRDGNIQTVESPLRESSQRDIITSYGIINPLDPSVWYAYDLQNNEICFRKHSTNMKLATERFLIGQSDSSITSIHGEYIGNERGEINNVPVLPGPIIAINDDIAYSEHGYVKLPLQPINVVYNDSHGAVFAHGKSKTHLSGNVSPTDSRITTRIEFNLSAKSMNDGWIGFFSGDYAYMLRNEDRSLQVLVFKIISGLVSIDSVIEPLMKSNSNVLLLENLVIDSCESVETEKQLYTTAAQLLAKVWTQERVIHLIEVNGPRSIKVLAAMSDFFGIDDSATVEMIQRSINSSSITDCLAVLWVYVNRPQIVKQLCIPFGIFQYIPEPATTRIGCRIANQDGDKLLNDAEHVLRDLTKSQAIENFFAIKLLHKAVTFCKFPSSEDQLVKLVRLVIPAINTRIRGAKQILTKLVATNQIQYHQGGQKLLVPTPHSSDHVAIVVNMTNNEEQQLKKIEGNTSPLQPIFNADGKVVMAAVDKKRYAWYIVRTFDFLRSNTIVEPVELQ